jgi:ferredoxin
MNVASFQKQAGSQDYFIQINAEMSKIWPVISSRKGPLPDADSFNGKPNKRDLLEK